MSAVVRALYLAFSLFGFVQVAVAGAISGDLISATGTASVWVGAAPPALPYSTSTEAGSELFVRADHPAAYSIASGAAGIEEFSLYGLYAAYWVEAWVAEPTLAAWAGDPSLASHFRRSYSDEFYEPESWVWSLETFILLRFWETCPESLTPHWCLDYLVSIHPRAAGYIKVWDAGRLVVDAIWIGPWVSLAEPLGPLVPLSTSDPALVRFSVGVWAAGIPEPSSLFLVGSGGLLVALSARRRG